MLKSRIIPVLLLENGGLVKTTKFKRPIYVGDPINTIKIFNDKEVDEVVVIDISASRMNRSPDFRLIEEFASECFMPLTYGGGIRNMSDANMLFSLGVEKICIQTAAIESPKLITDLVERFGSQAIVLSIDVKRSLSGSIKLHRYRGDGNKNITWKQILKTAIEAGIGEVLLCDVGKEGTMSGIDFNLVKTVSDGIPVPLIYVGGIGKMSDFGDALIAGADAVGAGSYFVFHGNNRAVLITYPNQDLIELEIQRMKHAAN